jgi:hypothetical protein
MNNVERVQAIYEAFGRGDVPAVLDEVVRRLEPVELEVAQPLEEPFTCSLPVPGS